MVVLPLVSLEEYERTAYEPDMEYADGVLIGRNVGMQLHGLSKPSSLHTYTSFVRHLDSSSSQRRGCG